jgi:hypothetical protein
MRELLQNVHHFNVEEPEKIIDDKEDYTAIRYGDNCTLRGRQVTNVRSLRDPSVHILKLSIIYYF